jgi:hypothetical protein
MIIMKKDIKTLDRRDMFFKEFFVFSAFKETGRQSIKEVMT